MFNKKRIGLLLQKERKEQSLSIADLIKKSNNAFDANIANTIEDGIWDNAMMPFVMLVSKALGIEDSGFLWEPNQQTIQQRQMFVIGAIIKKRRIESRLEQEHLLKLCNNTLTIEDIRNIEENTGDTTTNAINAITVSILLNIDVFDLMASLIIAQRTP